MTSRAFTARQCRHVPLNISTKHCNNTATALQQHCNSTASHCNTLQHVAITGSCNCGITATHDQGPSPPGSADPTSLQKLCIKLQHTAPALQHTIKGADTFLPTSLKPRCNKLQHTASALQHTLKGPRRPTVQTRLPSTFLQHLYTITATHCNTLQLTATHCNTLSKAFTRQCRHPTLQTCHPRPPLQLPPMTNSKIVGDLGP